MSGFGKAVPKAWRRGVSRAQAATRDTVVDFELEAKRFRALAPVLGWCGSCGVTVDEAAGALHANDCPYLPAERRRA